MSEEQHRHHLFHHKHDNEDFPPPQSDYDLGYEKPSYGQTDYPSQPDYPQSTDYPDYNSGGYGGDYDQQQQPSVVERTEVYESRVNDGEVETIRKEYKQSKHKEHAGELGAVAAGAFALYERHEAKKDPEHAHKHKIEEELAAATAVGAGGYAFHEHHNKKEAKEEEEEEEEEEGGHKKHHFF